SFVAHIRDAVRPRGHDRYARVDRRDIVGGGVSRVGEIACRVAETTRRRCTILPTRNSNAATYRSLDVLSARRREKLVRLPAWARCSRRAIARAAPPSASRQRACRA